MSEQNFSEAFERLETAVLRRNPEIKAALMPPRAPDEVRAELKRAGIRGNIEPLVQLWGWHDGAYPKPDSNARMEGIAPPLVLDVPKKTIEFMQGLGYKIDPNQKSRIAFNFYGLKGSIGWMKLWKKFGKADLKYAVLVARFVPFMSNNSGDELAMDVTEEGKTRMVLISAKQEVRLAYDSVAFFLEDLIGANEENRVLACVQTPGPVLELTPLVKMKPPAPAPVDSERFRVIRTDFSDDGAWERLRKKLDGEGKSDLDFISDRAFEAAPVEELRSRTGASGVAFVADVMTFSNAENLLLAADLSKKTPKTFRVTVEGVKEVADNLSIGNMDFKEFAAAAKDSDGVFRGCDV